MNLSYQHGFANHFNSEAIPGALPVGQNTPQQVPYNLYAEQISGSAFTMPRSKNLRSWLYRIQPSVVHGNFISYPLPLLCSAPIQDQACSPNQQRWSPLPIPTDKTDFIHGLTTYAAHGDIESGQGAAIHLYVCNQSMQDSYFVNADGDFLIVPQLGELLLHTEFGRLTLSPKEIALIPKGIKFRVELLDAQARGYICENYGAPFILPDLGPIGANGLANPRDFCAPVAHYEQLQGQMQLIMKFQGHCWRADIDHSPLDVVAWHGNYCPYKYNLALFNTINTVSYDHPDPSIFTVLTSPTAIAGQANVDFVIFPPRWMVAEHTFRPPYYHRNLMSEFMGLITGVYDAKADSFAPGGASLHNSFCAHGPDSTTYHQAIDKELQPQRYRNTLAFMFESRNVWQLTEFALTCANRQQDYLACWQGLSAHFNYQSGEK